MKDAYDRDGEIWRREYDELKAESSELFHRAIQAAGVIQCNHSLSLEAAAAVEVALIRMALAGLREYP